MSQAPAIRVYEGQAVIEDCVLSGEFRDHVEIRVKLRVGGEIWKHLAHLSSELPASGSSPLGHTLSKAASSAWARGCLDADGCVVIRMQDIFPEL